MSYEFARTLIIWTGWPVLFLGTVWTVSQSYAFYVAVHKSIYGKLVMLTASGWLITMFCLGAVSTWFLYADPFAAIWVVGPAFAIWAFCMAVIALVVARWNKMAIALNDMHLRLEHLVEERTEQLESERKKVMNLNVVLEERVATKTAELERKIRETQKVNELLVGRELKMKELKDQIDALREPREQAPPTTMTSPPVA